MGTYIGTHMGTHMKMHMDSFIKSYGKIETRNGTHVDSNLGSYEGSYMRLHKGIFSRGYPMGFDPPITNPEGVLSNYSSFHPLLQISTNEYYVKTYIFTFHLQAVPLR